MECIVKDYERLIPLDIRIPIYNDKIIKFSFKAENLPHLLGLNRLLDIEVLGKYANKEDDSVKAGKVFKMMKDKDITMDLLKSSSYFEEVYDNKIKYFSSDNILKAIKNETIIKFDPNSIKDFDTKLDKVDYMFYQIIIEEKGHYYHFGIGFSNKDGEGNFPITFFVRGDDTYINSEKDKVFPTSVYIKNTKGKDLFNIHWNNIRKCLIENKKCYRKLKRIIENNNLDMLGLNKDNINTIDIKSEDLIILKDDFIKLRRDEVYEAYKPHIKFESWNNTYKDYLVALLDKSDKDYLPNEIAIYFNEINSKVKRS
ncbi:PBECR4 domain-containing protein [Clostridium butyricum]|uniref:PBECR4 domain-containing protein n=1 Tax=Clostridium butyricum TaxID=1492 RepID=UPI0022E4E5A4|nr:PBECR4 domain-containing protein [Clostridium butyricum]